MSIALTQNLRTLSGSMIRQSIRRRIVAIENVDVELGRAKACAGGIIENGAHPRREISAGGILGLPRPVVDVSGIVDRRNFLDRGVAGDEAVFGRFCRRCGGRNCGCEKERDDQPEDSGKGIVHVRWSVGPIFWFKAND